MNKKNINKLSLNILNLLHLETNLKKKNTIPIPLNKIKSSISSSLLFLNQRNNNNQIHRPKNLNNKNILHTNKTKNVYSTKFNELIQSKKFIPKSNKKISSTKKIPKKNISKINNINQININNNINIINHLEPNPFDYLINSSNSLKKKRSSYSVKEKRKNNFDKEKEINCFKINSNNNTNSTSTNTNNINKKCKIKNDNNSNSKNNIEEIQINNQKLKSKIDKISLENKNLNKKIKQLRNKNLELKKVLYITKKERDDYSKSINQSLKLLKTLKENGLDLSKIIENLSNSDNEEYEDEEEDEEIYNFNNIKKLENNIIKLKEKEKNIEKYNEDSEFLNVSLGRFEFNEKFRNKKIPKGLKNIPKLKINDINKIS